MTCFDEARQRQADAEPAEQERHEDDQVDEEQRDEVLGPLPERQAVDAHERREAEREHDADAVAEAGPHQDALGGALASRPSRVAVNRLPDAPKPSRPIEITM